MLEKEMTALRTALIPLLRGLVDNDIGVGKMLLTDPKDEKPLALIIVSVEPQKIAALDEFVLLLQMDVKKPEIKEFTLDSKGELIDDDED